MVLTRWQQARLNTAMIEHLREGNTELLRETLAAGADVNYHVRGGYSALTMAVIKKLKECVEILLKAGADVNLRECVKWHLGKGKSSPLSMALIMGNNLEITKLLLSAGADVNQLDMVGRGAKYYWPSLMTACFSGSCRKGCLEMLLELGANVNQKEGEGNTPVIMSTALRHQKCVRVLLGYGADVSEVCRNDMTAAMHARTRTMCKVLLAAERKGPHPLNPANLQNLCRTFIRRHLLRVHPNSNLLCLMPRLQHFRQGSALGVPKNIVEYLLYGQKASWETDPNPEVPSCSQDVEPEMPSCSHDVEPEVPSCSQDVEPEMSSCSQDVLPEVRPAP